MMTIVVEGTVEQLHRLLEIDGVSMGRATPEVRPGYHAVHATVYRDAAVDEIRALGASVRVLKSNEELRAEAEQDHAQNLKADAARRSGARSYPQTNRTTEEK